MANGLIQFDTARPMYRPGTPRAISRGHPVDTTKVIPAS